VSILEKQQYFAELTIQLFEYILKQKYKFTYGEAYRPQEMQDLYWKQGKTRTRNSQHGKRLAIDVNLFMDGVYLNKTEDYAFLGTYWQSLDPLCVWGGSWRQFKDGNHFELKAE